MKKFGLSLVIVFYLSCIHDSNIPILFYEELKSTIKNEELISKIKEAPADSLEIYFYDSLGPIFYNLRKKEEYQARFQLIKNSIESKGNESFDRLIIFSFQDFLNRKEIDFKKIDQEIKVLDKKLKLKEIEDEKRIKSERLKIYNLNNSNWDEGDTINIVFPVDTLHGFKRILRGRRYPYSLDYSNDDDSINIKGILLNRTIRDFSEEESSEHHQKNLEYLLKIIELSDSDTYDSPGKKLETGKEFSFYVWYYGRMIE